MKHEFYSGEEDGLDETTKNMVLRGGLAVCKACGNYEGGLSTDCPGVITRDKADEIYAGEIDFVGGKWISLSQHVTPNKEKSQSKPS